MSNRTDLLHKQQLQSTTPATVAVYQTSLQVKHVPTAKGEADTSVATLKTIMAKLTSNKVGIIFGSRLVSLHAVIRLLKAGDEILVVDNIDRGKVRLLTIIDKKFGISVKYIHTKNTEDVFASVTLKTKLIWIDTPTFSELKISEIQAIAKGPKPDHVCFAWIALLLHKQHNIFLKWELLLCNR